MEFKKRDTFPFNFKKIPSEKVYFTSDNHFMHKNILGYTNRPFTSVEDMDEELIKNWNSVVTDDDLIFCLGDFALGNGNKCNEILKRLKGNKVLIMGNHEKTVVSYKINVEEFNGGIYEMLEIGVIDESLENGKQDIILSHYPMLAWNKSHRGSIQLFGHLHGVFDDKEFLHPNQMDVGVDSNHFKPISYYEVKQKLFKR